MIKPNEYMHPEDAKALRELESIPGFPTLVKKVLALGLEKLQYGINMASAIRLSPTQLPEIYNRLPPICEKLGIKEPEFYLSMDPYPNAWTFGDTKIFVTVTSGLLQLLNDEEIDAVIAHECGHIACRHVLYHSLAHYILSGADNLGVLGLLSIPIQLASLYWERKSELSCDRAGSLVTSPEVVASTMARLSGGPIDITEKIDLEEWARQADQYDAIRNDGIWNKTLQIYAIAQQNHPFAAVRVREILKWGKSEQYQRLIGINPTDIARTVEMPSTPPGNSATSAATNYSKTLNISIFMLFNEQGIINIDEIVANHPSWKKMMDDGVITAEEVHEQAQVVIGLLKKIDDTFSESQKALVEQLLTELSVLFAASHVNAIQEISKDI